LPGVVHLGRAASAFTERPATDRATGDAWPSRFSRMEIPCMPWFCDPAGPTAARGDAAIGVAFRQTESVGIPDCHFGAQ
jgi:hypothetical protein